MFSPVHFPPFCLSGVGLNSGVMLMNLTRIRASNFTTCIDEYYKFYGDRLRLGDQDLLNVYFHFHNRELYFIITKTCLYNFDPLKSHFYIVKLGFTGI